MPLPVAPPNFDGDDDGGAVASPLSEFDEQEGSGSPPSASSTGEGAAAAETAGTAVASTNHSSAPVPYNFKGGIKGTLGLRDLFGLLGHGLGLLPSEQAYVMDELVLASANEKGHSLKEASTLASKVTSIGVSLFRVIFSCTKYVLRRVLTLLLALCFSNVHKRP